MKRLNLLIAAFFAVFFLVSYSNAQCVQCLPSNIVPDTLSCQPSASGGKECSPSSNGQSCLIAGVCTSRPGGDGGGDPGETGGGSRLTQSPGNCFKEKIGKVEFDKLIIREVGEKHARLAIALAWLDQSGFLGTKDVRIYLSPLEINNEVYNKWLNDISAESQETVLSALHKNASKRERLPSPPKGAEPIIYAVDVVSSENSINTIIRFSPIKGSPSDPTFTSLDLVLEEVHSPDSVAIAEKKWKVINWEIK